MPASRLSDGSATTTDNVLWVGRWVAPHNVTAAPGTSNDAEYADALIEHIILGPDDVLSLATDEPDGLECFAAATGHFGDSATPTNMMLLSTVHLRDVYAPRTEPTAYTRAASHESPPGKMRNLSGGARRKTRGDTQVAPATLLATSTQAR